MVKRLVAISLFAGGMVACSNGGTGSGAKSSAVSQVHKESYQFVENGCDTSKHDFSSSDADDVNKQLCNALQDDDLNNGCAADMRQQLYEQKCS